MDDLISRKAAIDALANMMPHSYTPDGSHPADEGIFMVQEIFADCIQTLKELTPAQPEVIRCTECKHYREYDSEYVENAVVAQCMADRYPISETIPDGWFCAGAERKDNG